MSSGIAVSLGEVAAAFVLVALAIAVSFWRRTGLWTLFGSIAIATLIATTLAYRNFFTPAHQLREPPVP